MIESNIQNSKWNTNQINIATFNGNLRIKSDELRENGKIFQHVTYIVKDTITGKIFAGIGDGADETMNRLVSIIKNYYIETYGENYEEEIIKLMKTDANEPKHT